MRATLAVVLAGGLGSRFRADDGTPLSEAQRAAADVGAKALTPVHGRPLLDYLLHELAEGGVRDVVFVLSPSDPGVRARYEDVAPPNRLRVRFAVQETPRGTADALLAARSVVECPTGAARDDSGRGHFLVCNADNLYPAASVAALVGLDGPGFAAYDGTALNAEDAGGTAEDAEGNSGGDDGRVSTDALQRFALVRIAADGTLTEIIEKPAPTHPLVRARKRWVSMNLWRFTDAIFDDCASVRPSERGELELVDAVRGAMARGERFVAVKQRAAVPDLSRRRDVAALERLLAGRTPRP